MANFDLSKYQTVEERLRTLYEVHPDARVITDDYTTPEDRAASMWRVKAFIYLNAGDLAAQLPKATGHAFEIDGAGMAQKTAALETCETSAIGRALANMGMNGSAPRASREEMAKAQRGMTPAKPATPAPEGWRGLIADCATVPDLSVLHEESVKAGWYSDDVKAALTARKKQLVSA